MEKAYAGTKQGVHLNIYICVFSVWGYPFKEFPKWTNPIIHRTPPMHWPLHLQPAACWKLVVISTHAWIIKFEWNPMDGSTETLCRLYWTVAGF